MSVQTTIERKLTEAMTISHLEVVNESNNHNVPPGSESHFKVVVVAPEFEGKSLVQRHRMIYSLVSEELAQQVHALALHTYTEQDWVAIGNAPTSPDCRGGKAKESV